MAPKEYQRRSFTEERAAVVEEEGKGKGAKVVKRYVRDEEKPFQKMDEEEIKNIGWRKYDEEKMPRLKVKHAMARRENAKKKA